MGVSGVWSKTIPSVAVSLNGLNLKKKQAKNGRFFSKNIGQKMGKILTVHEKTAIFCDKAQAGP